MPEFKINKIASKLELHNGEVAIATWVSDFGEEEEISALFDFASQLLDQETEECGLLITNKFTDVLDIFIELNCYGMDTANPILGEEHKGFVEKIKSDLTSMLAKIDSIRFIAEAT